MASKKNREQVMLEALVRKLSKRAEQRWITKSKINPGNLAESAELSDECKRTFNEGKKKPYHA